MAIKFFFLLNVIKWDKSQKDVTLRVNLLYKNQYKRQENFKD